MRELDLNREENTQITVIKQNRVSRNIVDDDVKLCVRCVRKRKSNREMMKRTKPFILSCGSRGIEMEL